MAIVLASLDMSFRRRERPFAGAHYFKPDSGDDEDPVKTDLTARLQQRQSQLTAMKTTDTDTKTKARLNAEFGDIARKVPAPVGLVMDATAEATKTSGAALDRAVVKGGLMIDYVRHRIGVTDEKKLSRVNEWAETFSELLQNSNVTSITEAIRVLQQICDDVAPESLRRSRKMRSQDRGRPLRGVRAHTSPVQHPILRASDQPRRGRA
jgi:hypothetical protein